MNAVNAHGATDVLQEGVPLAPFTTYRFGGTARLYAEVTDSVMLVRALAARRRYGDPPLLVLGRGSNLVISDSGFPGLVIRLVGEFAALDIAGDGTVKAGAAVSLPHLARVTVRSGRGGLEWCVGIPGSVGGAVRMNAGGHGSDTASWLIEAEVLAGGKVEATTINASDLGLSYRQSSLTDDDVVLSATYRTVARETVDGKALLREITRWRRTNQPGGTLNAGSVFKNPPEDSAGRIIDATGLKGHRVGGAAVSMRHANFFEADRSATAQDVYDLVADVRRRVTQATGVDLVPEIRFVGAFRNRDEGRTG